MLHNEAGCLGLCQYSLATVCGVIGTGQNGGKLMHSEDGGTVHEIPPYQRMMENEFRLFRRAGKIHVIN